MSILITGNIADLSIPRYLYYQIIVIIMHMNIFERIRTKIFLINFNCIVIVQNLPESENLSKYLIFTRDDSNNALFDSVIVSKMYNHPLEIMITFYLAKNRYTRAKFDFPEIT